MKSQFYYTLHKYVPTLGIVYKELNYSRNKETVKLKKCLHKL